jgi:hypothetical protein
MHSKVGIINITTTVYDRQDAIESYMLARSMNSENNGPVLIRMFTKKLRTGKKTAYNVVRIPEADFETEFYLEMLGQNRVWSFAEKVDSRELFVPNKAGALVGI